MKYATCPECQSREVCYENIDYIGPKGGKHRVYRAYCKDCGYKAAMNGATKLLALHAFEKKLTMEDFE